MKQKQLLAELDRIEQGVRRVAVDLREPKNAHDRADPEFDADRLDKEADRINWLSTNIRGSGTGED